MNVYYKCTCDHCANSISWTGLFKFNVETKMWYAEHADRYWEKLYGVIDAKNFKRLSIKEAFVELL